MGKGKRVRTRRTAKRPSIVRHQPKETPGGIGWHPIAELDTFDFAFPQQPPRDDPIWDRSACPVDDHCSGCGDTTGLRVMLSVFGSGEEVACTTVCKACDGTSMLHLTGVGMLGLDARIEAHAAHRATR